MVNKEVILQAHTILINLYLQAIQNESPQVWIYLNDFGVISRFRGTNAIKIIFESRTLSQNKKCNYATYLRSRESAQFEPAFACKILQVSNCELYKFSHRAFFERCALLHWWSPLIMASSKCESKTLAFPDSSIPKLSGSFTCPNYQAAKMYVLSILFFTVLFLTASYYLLGFLHFILKVLLF